MPVMVRCSYHSARADVLCENLIVEVECGRVHSIPIPPSDMIWDWSSVGDTLSVTTANRDHVSEHPGKGTYPLRQIDLIAPDGSRRQRITKDPLLETSGRVSPQTDLSWLTSGARTSRKGSLSRRP